MIDYTCKTCGSHDVRRDAYVTWDRDRQVWIIEAIFDHAECGSCGGETTLVEEEN